MTPQELRERAWKNIESARQLLDTDPDLASYLAGYAVEYMLKNRFCTRRGWTDFPEDRKAAKQRGAPEVITHDLNELLRLNADTGIDPERSTHIEWKRASDWNVERRYTPVGTRSREDTVAQIDETEKLFHQLVDYEVLERLLFVELNLSRKRGPFNLFAYVHDPVLRGWELWCAARTPPGAADLSAEYIKLSWVYRSTPLLSRASRTFGY